MTIAQVNNQTKLIEYATSLGMGPDLSDRVKTAFEFAQALSPSEILDCFISEYMSAEEKRQYGNIYFFYSDGLLEAENWMSATRLYLFSLRCPDFLIFTSREGTWSAAGTSPSLKIEGQWNNFRVDLMANGENCNRLIEIHKRYLEPHQKAASVG